MDNETIQTAIYLRISLDRDMDNLAIERQREDCEKIAKDRSWEVVGEYVDQSKSATDKTKHRPEYDRMVLDYNLGKFEAIICYDLDRLTRQPRQIEDWIDAAEDEGLLLITVTDSVDLSTDNGRMYARIKAAVARSEVDRKGARQRRAHQQRAKQGRPPHGVRPLGYDNKGNIIETEAKAVRAMYESFASGASLKAIARALSGDKSDDLPHVPEMESRKRTLTIERNMRREKDGKKQQPVPENTPWNPASVLGILRNPRYAAYSTYTPTKELKEGDRRRKWHEKIMRDENNEIIVGNWEPIVEPDVWWRVQEILNDPARQTSRKGTDRKHLGSGLYICGICGKKIRAHSNTYRCAGDLMRSREQVDSFVLQVIKERLSLDDIAGLLPSANAPRMEELSKQIGIHKASIMRAQHDYDEEIIEGYDLKRIRDKAQAEISRLESERLKYTSTGLGSILAATDPVKAFENADLASRRTVIDALCTVELHPHPRGVKKFDGSDVLIKWKSEVD